MIVIGTRVRSLHGTGSDGNATLDLASGADILGVCNHGIQSYAGDIRVRFRLRIERGRRVADGCVRHSHPSIEPWTAAQTTDYWDRNRINNGGPCHRPGESE